MFQLSCMTGYTRLCLIQHLSRGNLGKSCSVIAGRVRIRDLLLSSTLAELLDLCTVPEDAAASAQHQVGNWFAVRAVSNLQRQFEQLDEDGDGLLSASEFAGCAVCLLYGWH